MKTNNVSDKLAHLVISNQSNDIQNSNNEVTRLKNDSCCDKSENTEVEKEESGDASLLGEDEDFDDIDKLMDIMEAEMAYLDVQVSNKKNENLAHYSKNGEKSPPLKHTCEFNGIAEPVTTNISKAIEESKFLLSPFKEEFNSMKILKEIKNSSAQCNHDLRGSQDVSKQGSQFQLSSPIRKNKISPYSKTKQSVSSLSKSSPRRSLTPEKYKFPLVQIKPHRRPLSFRKLPLREKNIFLKQYSPTKSCNFYQLLNLRITQRSLSRDISAGTGSLSPLRSRSSSPFKIKSISRPSNVELANKVKSQNPFTKIMVSKPVFPTSSQPVLLENINQYKVNEVDNTSIKKRENFSAIDLQVESKPIDLVLRKRKFESNKPTEQTRKIIVLTKTNSAQEAVKTKNEEIQNDKIRSEITPTFVNITQKEVISSPKKINFKHRQRVVLKCKTNEILDKENNNNLLNEKEMKINFKIKVIPSETSSTSKDFEEINEQKQQECRSIGEEYIDEEKTQVQQMVDYKKSRIQFHDVDLRTELIRRRALRLMNKIEVGVQNKPKSFYPTSLLQSSIRNVVCSRYPDENPIKCEVPKLSITFEVNSNSRRVVMIDQQKTGIIKNNIFHKNQEDYSDNLKPYSCGKQLKKKLKEVPEHLKINNINHDNSISKGPRKILKRNINVTNF